MLKKMPVAGRKTASAVFALVGIVVPVLGYVYGGYYVNAWGLAAFAFAALVCAAALFGLLGGARSWWSVAATSLFLTFAAWTFASILWSANREDAWSGASLTLLYLLGFWLSATLIALGASRRRAMSVLAVGPGVVAALTLLTLDRGGKLFESGRLLGTVGYFNAEAAFLLVSFWVAVYVAGSRRVHPAVRGAALASATLGVEVSVLTQSRGAALALLVSLGVFFVFSGRRLRGFVALIPVAVSLLVSFEGLNQVYLSFESAGSGLDALEKVEGTMWLTTIAAGVYGLAWGWMEGRWRPREVLVRTTGALALACAVAVIFVGGLLFVERVGNPVSWTTDQWSAFKTDNSSAQNQSRFLSASGSGRYVLWQVAWEDFVRNPILGVGTQNYEATYYQNRSEVVGWVKQPHSLPLEILAERGIVGGLLFAGFLGTCVAAGLWKRFSDLNSEGKAQVGALLAAVTYWFVHSSAEWFWQMPAVTLPAIIYLAMLVAPWKRPTDAEEVYAPSDRPLKLAGVGVAALTLATVGPLYAADYFQHKAQAESNPWQAAQELEQARAFNPLDPDLARQEADLAFETADIPRATQLYARAISLNPRYYAPYAILGGVYEKVGQPQRALGLYREALRLNPLDPDLPKAVSRVERQVKAES